MITKSSVETSRPPDHVQSLMRGLRILEHVHRAGAPVSVRDVAEALSMNVSTTHHLVNTLVWEGYLLRGRDRRLIPGRGPGSPAAPEDAPGMRRALGRAAYAVDDVAVLSRLRGGEAYVAASTEVPGATSSGHYATGARDLAHMLAVGRVLLAWQAPDVAAESIEATRRLARERREIFDEQALMDDLAEIRDRRYATLIGHAHACVAAPVVDPADGCVAAVAVVVTPARVRRDLERLVAVTKSTALAISSTPVAG